MNPLAKHLVSRMPQLTAWRSARQALDNARQNLPYIRHTIAEFSARPGAKQGESAIVISAGPSLHRKNPVVQIVASGYAGSVIAVDGALGYCLRNGLVPDYIVTVDPHPTRVCRWFGDPDLESRIGEDDYFRRQDLDPHLGTKELERNRELLELVNRHGRSMKAIVCTSVAPNVTHRCRESGMEMYWWNPMLDDVEQPGSITRKLYEMNQAPCMVTGGNVGTAAWVFAHQVLGKREVALVGMDLSYAPGTPLERTQYYVELKELFGERAGDAMIGVENSYLGEVWYADPAYYWYRECFLELARQAPCVTYNCTEGGILFGDGIQVVPLNAFLANRSCTREVE